MTTGLTVSSFTLPLRVEEVSEYGRIQMETLVFIGECA